MKTFVSCVIKMNKAFIYHAQVFILFCVRIFSKKEKYSTLLSQKASIC